MSDFLTRLVMHAGRALDVIRPRPLSRFEELVRPSHELAEEEITLPVIRQSRRLFVTSDDRTEPTQSAPDGPATRDSMSVTEQGTRVVRPPADRSEAQSPHPTVQVHAPAAMRVSDTRPGTQPETVRHETTHTITRVVDQVVRHEPQPQASIGDGISSRTTPERKMADPLAPLAPTQPRAPLVKPAAIEASTRDARHGATPPTPETRVPRDLTVEITIGRVDVHAVMPPQPKVREPRTSKPEVSLDDYLRRRGRRT